LHSLLKAIHEWIAFDLVDPSMTSCLGESDILRHIFKRVVVSATGIGLLKGEGCCTRER
jgi:hypothetical protein